MGEEAASGAGSRKRRRLGFCIDLQLQCPCCYKPGNPFCDSCEPEDAAKKLVGLRSLLSAHSLDAYIVTNQDAHCSEYIAESDERLNFLTGFSGSSGTAVVTANQALLWTDSRYFLQAEKQLKGTEWTLMRQFQPGVLDLKEWIPKHLEGKVVGVDPVLVSAEVAEEWRAKWASKVELKEISPNLVDAIWFPVRPEDPCKPVVPHPLEHAGEAVTVKLDRLRKALKEDGADAIILSALDQIAWLFNLRGSDIDCNPVFFSYAAVFPDTATLFVRALDEGQPGLRDEVKQHLSDAGVVARPYGQFFADVKAAIAGHKVFVEPASSSMAIFSLVPADLRIKGTSPVERFKAVKNEKEIEGLRQASKRDSLALCELFTLIEEKLGSSDGEVLTEAGIADLMAKLRLAQPLCVGDSFPTISSAGPNSAVVHYRPEHGTCSKLDKGQIFLIDTGGQYKDGTTDITRTVHFGAPTPEQRRLFTRVLQGHTGLARAVFPEGTPGLMLDMLARQPLWQDGLNYGHGTGHGMGAYMNVHEGPFGIGGGSVPGDTIMGSERMKRVYLTPFVAGNFVSDEPGCYKDGEFGIRIESDLVVVPAETPFNMGSRPFLKFEYLTLVPFCKALIDMALLSPAEVEWVDAYHDKVWNSLESSLSQAKDARVRAWLRRATRPLGK